MRRVDAFSPAALAPTPGTAPVAAASSFGGGGASFRALDAEIRDYIANGSSAGSTEGGASQLNPAARAWLAQHASGGMAAPTTTSALAALDGDGSLAETNAGSPQRQDFVGQIAPHAEAAARQLGVAPDILVAHAALESGWGQRPLRGADGASTNNLFGLKAGAGWRGDSADSATTEYEQGVALKKTERFRAYGNTGDAFRDFTQLLQTSPRFQGALNTGTDARAYADALARGGYATDPNYADKLVGVVNRLRAK